jgi:hypothetical protein
MTKTAEQSTNTTEQNVERYIEAGDEALLPEAAASDLRWEQCYVALDETSVGKQRSADHLTQSAFAERVGVSRVTITFQCKLAASCSDRNNSDRPLYWDAMAELKYAKPEPKEGESKEVTALGELLALARGYRTHLDVLVGFDTGPSLSETANQVAGEFEALTSFLRRWAAGEEISEAVYNHLSILADAKLR